jgi:hypothetical protein
MGSPDVYSATTTMPPFPILPLTPWAIHIKGYITEKMERAVIIMRNLNLYSLYASGEQIPETIAPL